MEITQTNNLNDGRFEATDGPALMGYIDYIWDNDNRFTIAHTEVAPAYNGQGVGKALVQAAAGYARQAGKKVAATCPFARGYFSKHPEYNDIFIP